MNMNASPTLVNFKIMFFELGQNYSKIWDFLLSFIVKSLKQNDLNSF